ncbi:hypothetical protein D1007_11250 [Hordeum vulgare]|nr:hypothetical protein D1007_11250 [Hordeum vulgare]
MCDLGDSGDAGDAGDAGAMDGDGEERRNRLPSAPEASESDTHALTPAENEQPSQISSASDINLRRRWKISYSEIDRTYLNGGTLLLHLVSRWMTIRDKEDDILVGRHLQEGGLFSEGVRISIDIYNVTIISEILQVQAILQEHLETIDLSSDEEVKTKPKLGLPRVGGRFWVLAEEDDEEMDEQPSLHAEELSSPDMEKRRSPEEVIRLSVKSARKTSGTVRKSNSVKIKPLKGPMPKVSMEPLKEVSISVISSCETKLIAKPSRVRPGHVVPGFPVQLGHARRLLVSRGGGASLYREGAAPWTWRGVVVSSRRAITTPSLSRSEATTPGAVAIKDRLAVLHAAGRGAPTEAGRGGEQPHGGRALGTPHAGRGVGPAAGRDDDNFFNHTVGGNRRFDNTRLEFGSSSNAGRDYEGNRWHGGDERSFNPPIGNFVEGATGPQFWYRPTAGRAGRGGGGRNFGRNPRKTTTVMPTTMVNTTPENVDDSVDEETQSAALPEAAAAAVKALVVVTVPIADNSEAGSKKGSHTPLPGRANKISRKKEKMCCFRCGESGHFATDCTTTLCDLCTTIVLCCWLKSLV